MIQIDGLRRSFGDVQAVREVSLKVAPGEIVGLLGANGAGKTTTMRSLATLIKPDAGELNVAGIDVLEFPQQVRAKLGYQTGDTGLYTRLTPREFLVYFAKLHGLSKAESRQKVDELIGRFQISEYADRVCEGLSTGQKQRVILARTLLHSPPVLVLDEPTSGLDILASRYILDTIRDYAKAGNSVLFSTHVLSEVEYLCDRIYVIHKGRTVANGTRDELLALTGTSTIAEAFLALLEGEESDLAPHASLLPSKESP